jgi:hypothetical protein
MTAPFLSGGLTELRSHKEKPEREVRTVGPATIGSTMIQRTRHVQILLWSCLLKNFPRWLIRVIARVRDRLLPSCRKCISPAI